MTVHFDFHRLNFVKMNGTQDAVNPYKKLELYSKELNLDVTSEAFAREMDARDKLARFKHKVFYPLIKDLPNSDVLNCKDPSAPCLYFCGHSLGLQPKSLPAIMQRQMDAWANLGVFGHFEGEMPWAQVDELAQRPVAEVVGALPHEVAVMNGLTVNLHLLLQSFYQPTAERFKILYEAKAFPSDHYAFESQVRSHGLDPESALLALEPRAGEELLRHEDILRVIKEQGASIAVICFPGVQYYTGQLFNISDITRAGHEAGCYVGWDLAHAVGNVELSLHDWDIDFAVWCHYKYMGAGAGATAGAFLHQRLRNANLPKLEGWWGHHISTRFDMDNCMDKTDGIAGYRLSNPSIFATAPVKVGAELILEAGMGRLRRKSLLLTAFLERLLTKELATKDGDLPFEVITPRAPAERGSQLSIRFRDGVGLVFDELERRGAVCDKRMPAVLRITPHALYTSFVDVHSFVQCLKEVLAL